MQETRSTFWKADVRIILQKFRSDDYAFIRKLVSLCQFDQRWSVRSKVLSALKSLCLLDRSIITVLLCGELPLLLVLGHNFQEPLTESEISSLDLLASLFSTGEKFPVSHYDVITLEFVTKVVQIMEKYVEAFQFILSFNAHFETDENLVVEALCFYPPIDFGQLLTVELNRCRADNKDLRAVKLLKDIFCCTGSPITVLFYDNDLKVLYGILCQDLIDTNQPEKISLILEILKNVDVMERCEYISEVVSSLETFLLTREVQPEAKLAAELILRRVRERELNRSTVS
ncbi:unnamed protein product [Gongylonema pulchrum]|uniref:DUF2013 domain-containing protein n=1 Tax=Gongylonema pulchrum TaxID=637853 RepID=A0A183DQX8_9BILA|nr:unnamed protein product [Gongylonema pulchrum]